MDTRIHVTDEKAPRVIYNLIYYFRIYRQYIIYSLIHQVTSILIFFSIPLIISLFKFSNFGPNLTSPTKGKYFQTVEIFCTT